MKMLVRHGSRYLFAATFLALLAAAARDGFAQDTTRLAPGTRIRLERALARSDPSIRWLEGELLTVTADSLCLLVADRADALTLATRAIELLETGGGLPAPTGRGALIGAAAGALFGITLLGMEDGTRAALPFGVFGLGLGALVEEATRAERWERVSPPWVEGRGNLTESRLEQVLGSRVRLYASQTADGRHGWFVGRVVQRASDSLVLRTDDDVTMVAPVASVTQLEVSRGRQSNWAPGAGYGWLLGAASGAILVLASGSDESGTAGEKALGVIALAGLGTVVGLIAGASTTTERWEKGAGLGLHF